MVSTQSQYITDFVPKIMEPGKSPLAMLAKTCETIGADTPSKKSPSDKKDDKRSHEPSTSSSSTIKKSSPRATPAAKEPTLTFPGLPKPAGFPMGMHPMGFPFFNPMMGYPMQFPGFPMNPAGFMNAAAAASANRMPCPFAMMRQPCANPQCTQCPSSSAAAAAAAAVAANQQQMAQGFTPEMMAHFAATNPLFSMMMPAASGANPMPSFQSLLAASAASASASAASTSSSSSKNTSTTTTAPSTSSVSTPTSSTKHRCNWMEPTGVCGKTFTDEDELANHVKAIHTPSPPSSASSSATEPAVSSASSSLKTPTSRPTSSASLRFNPYGKIPTSMPTMMPPMALNPMMMFQNPLQAMYTQRLMSSMPHP